MASLISNSFLKRGKSSFLTPLPYGSRTKVFLMDPFHSHKVFLVMNILEDFRQKVGVSTLEVIKAQMPFSFRQANISPKNQRHLGISKKNPAHTIDIFNNYSRNMKNRYLETLNPLEHCPNKFCMACIRKQRSCPGIDLVRDFVNQQSIIANS